MDSDLSLLWAQGRCPLFPQTEPLVGASLFVTLTHERTDSPRP
jgi:hypothetical protein